MSLWDRVDEIVDVIVDEIVDEFADEIVDAIVDEFADAPLLSSPLFLSLWILANPSLSPSSMN